MFALVPDDPKPFNPTTTIRYTLLLQRTRLKLSVYHAIGQLVTTLVSGEEEPGDRDEVVQDWTGERGVLLSHVSGQLREGDVPIHFSGDVDSLRRRFP